MRAAPDIVEIGRAGGKVDAPGVGGVRAHLAEHEGAVGGTQRAHAKAVEHVAVGKAPVAPGEEARKIRLEIIGAEAITGKARIARQQHPAVPQLRLLALRVGKMRRYLGAPRLGERPGPRRHPQIERGDAMKIRKPFTGCGYFALAPVVFSALSTKALV